MRHLTRSLLTILATIVVTAALTSTAASAAPFCGITWGSGVKDNPEMDTGEVDTVRAGRHDCFDRLVVDIDGPAAGYRTEYVDQVRADGSGDVVPTPGGARIQFVVRHPSMSLGVPVGGDVVNVAGFDTLRSVKFAGSFEGQTTFGVGTRARLPFRVFTLPGPGGHSRIVLDVAHRW